MKQWNKKKMCFASMIVAVGVIGSNFYIPIGPAKCLPIQHMINVVGGILLGPAYSVAIAFLISTIRILLGMGTLLAYSGSMSGAFLCGFLYQKTKKKAFAYVGEVVGTGLIGAMLSYPIGTLLLGKEMALFGMVIPFCISTIGGTVIAGILMKIALIPVDKEVFL